MSNTYDTSSTSSFTPHSHLSEKSTKAISLANSIETIEFTLNSLSLRGLSKCSDKSRIVLCLHGWLDNAASFLPLLPHFNDYHMIAIDFPGHGHSDHRSEGAHYHFFDYVYDLFELCELNQWEGIDIVGHSMGGMIASAFAAAFPEKVRSLTLIDSLGFIYSDETQTTQQLRSAMTTRTKTEQSVVFNKVRSFSKSAAIKARLSVSDLRAPDATLLIERSLRAFEHNKNEEQLFIWRSDKRLKTLSPYRLTMGQAKQLIKDIQCPVKLIFADNGLKLIQEYIPIAEQLIENFSAEKLTGGHHIHMEQPNDVASIIKIFLASN